MYIYQERMNLASYSEHNLSNLTWSVLETNWKDSVELDFEVIFRDATDLLRDIQTRVKDALGNSAELYFDELSMEEKRQMTNALIQKGIDLSRIADLKKSGEYIVHTPFSFLTGSSVIASSYLSEDDAMLGAEAQYCQMEQELQRYLDTYESTHNYDEYHFDLDDIEHDPYVLISILSALHEGEFTLDEVQGTLQMLFEKQYILTEEVIVETRYRTETDTWTDADGNTHTETYRVPYDYYICNVKLENFNLSHVPVYIMSQEQLSMYATYMSVLGNREDLFGDSPYVDKYITNPPADYDVNPEYLADEKFATLITEAEKYLGYPYVWGGSNPDTSFDCSGFVSYVLTNSGLVNTGRLGAQGLYNVCTPVSKANAQPGDLIFFVGTYDTPGVSHVGIYVGDGVMIHCGDPIQYTSINSSYWQQHFYAFGRPAY